MDAQLKPFHNQKIIIIIKQNKKKIESFFVKEKKMAVVKF